MALAIAWSAVASAHRAIYPIRESDLIVKPFDIPTHWPRAYGLDVGWRSTGAIRGALDPASGVLYFYNEYYSTDRQAVVHGQTIVAAERRFQASWTLSGTAGTKQTATNSCSSIGN